MVQTRRTFLTSALAAPFLGNAQAQASGSSAGAALGTSAAIDAAARDLLAKLTLDEKIGMMSGDAPFFAGFLKLAAGGYNRLPLMTAGTVPRLGIAGLHFTDGPRGVMLPGATTFPVPMARGASFDPALEERIGDAMGKEARAYGANIIGAPVVNLLRHPAWGRAQETYGEDNHHLGEMGAALTRGLQRHVMSCVKHFALNSIENARFQIDVTADPRTLREVYLPHFKKVVDAGAASVMSSYNSVNGEWAGQSRALLHDILVGEWGFTGFVQTDWIWGLRDAKKGALAGQQLEMPFQNQFRRFLPGLVQRGDVPQAVVDDAVLRILRLQIRFARNQADYPQEIIGSEAHRSLAREAAQKSIVLLKNDSNLLPLKNVRNLTIFGRLANLPNTGDGGSSSTQPSYVVTPFEGLRAAPGADFIIKHDDGGDLDRAAAAARFSDVAVVVVGYDSRDEGEYVSRGPGPWNDHFPKPVTPEEQALARRMAEARTAFPSTFAGDRTSLRLHPDDEKLILTVAAANPHTVVAIMGGSAVITESWRDKAAAILMLWYPGMEGGRAFADILLGKVNPSGKLPCIFPKRAEDLPTFDSNATKITYDLWHGYRKLERDKNLPAFPFGFGLSYTTFSLGKLELAQARLRTHDTIMLTAELTNTGPVAGEEVVQLYVGARSSKVERAQKELKAFTKLSLAPGEKRAVRFALPAAELAYYDPVKGWVVEPGRYEIILGRHSLDETALRAEIVLH